MSVDATETIQTLRTHQALCQDLLLLAEQESQDLLAQSQSQPQSSPPADPPASNASANPSSSAFDYYQRRKQILPKLIASIEAIKRHRTWWQRLTPEQRGRAREIDPLIRSTQDLIMKIVLLDRDNEKARLRLGLLPPSQLPPARSLQPHYVAQIYRRHAAPNA